MIAGINEAGRLIEAIGSQRKSEDGQGRRGRFS